MNKYLTEAQNLKFITSAEYQDSCFLVILRWSYELILCCDSSTWTCGSAKKTCSHDTELAQQAFRCKYTKDFKVFQPFICQCTVYIKKEKRKKAQIT